MIKQKINEKKSQIKILFLIFISLLLFALNNNLINEDYFAAEFSPMYIRGRALIEENLSPYSNEIKLKIDDLSTKYNKENNSWVYEISKAQNDSQFYFLNGIPAIILMFIPILIPTHKTALLVWLVINEAAIIGIILSISGIIPKRNRRMVFIFLMSSLLFLPIVFISLVNGSLIILEIFFAWLVVYLIVNEKDELAGVFLGLLLGRFLLFLPFMVAIFFYFFSQRRFKILKSFVLVIVMLLALSFIIDPQWLFELFYTISISIDKVGFGILSDVSSFLGIKSNIFEFIIIGLVLAIYLIEFILVRKRKMLSFVWFIVLQFSLLPLMGFPISISDYFVLYPAMAIIIIGWYAKFGKKLSTNLYIVSSVISLILWILTIQTIPVFWLEFFTLIIIIGNLYWVRWWITDFEKIPQSKREKIKVELKKRFSRIRREKKNNDVT